MHMKKLCIIVNPSSGQSLSVIPEISEFTKKNTFTSKINSTRKQGDAANFTAEAVKNNTDAVVVYGGDGTVMEAAGALMNTDTPLYILPGGTANILAKELQIPLVLDQALRLLSDHTTKIRRIDMGTVNGQPFILRVNSGVLADMIIETDPVAKMNFGQLAYSLSAIQQFANSTFTEYTITMDDKVEKISGSTLTVANTGNIGLSGVSFTPGISVNDGFLDIFVLRANKMGSLAGVITEAIMNRAVHDQLAHWRVKKARIEMQPSQAVLRDDVLLKDTKLDVAVVPSAISIAAPL